MSIDKEDIDFVVLYLDDSDPTWQKEFRRYAKDLDTNEDNSACRFRDWNTFRYWLRAVDKFAPWVRKIHIVTYGHVPSWLRTEHEKINVVRHSEIMPKSALPTFNSCAIESNIHRIKGLAEKFVYFNDDIFLTQLVTPSDYFKNGMPIYTYKEEISWPQIKKSYYYYNKDNSIGIVNRHFNKRLQIKKFFFKYFHFSISKAGLWDLIYLRMPHWNMLSVPHTEHPMLKSTFEDVWEKEPIVLGQTTNSKFRDMYNVNQHLFIFWSIAKGSFFSSRKVKKGENISISKQNLQRTVFSITNQTYKSICLNDTSLCKDFEECRKAIINAFDILLPNSCPFEK